MPAENPFPAASDYVPIKTWTGLARDVERAEIHGLVVKDFSPLMDLRRLKALRVVPDGEKQLAVLGGLDRLETLEAEHVPAKALAHLGKLKSLKALHLFAFGGTSLDGLEGLKSLRHLVIEHAPKLASLEALGALASLKSLSISTPPSWDASRRTIKVTTLAPLARLSKLESLALRGVEPQRDGLKPLARLVSLKELDFSHVFSLTMADYAGLAGALPKARGDCLSPTYKLVIGPCCKKCRTQNVWLTGSAPGTKRSLCPKCDEAKLKAHVAEFEKIRATAQK